MAVETTECLCICVDCHLPNCNRTGCSKLKLSVMLNYIWTGR